MSVNWASSRYTSAGQHYKLPIITLMHKACECTLCGTPINEGDWIGHLTGKDSDGNYQNVAISKDAKLAIQTDKFAHLLQNILQTLEKIEGHLSLGSDEHINNEEVSDGDQ